MIGCLLCGAPANLAPDPRLPLLRILACTDCKDRIAADAGWTRGARAGSRAWFRRGVTVQVSG